VIVRLLQPSDDRSGFSCGDSEYDDYLRKYAGQNDFRHHVGRTLVVVDDERVVGYATFTLGEVAVDALPDEIARRLPRYPMPVLRMARLAVDHRYQGAGLGRMLVSRVLALPLQLRGGFGCFAVAADALRTREAFYAQLGFERVELVQGRSRVPGAVLMVLMLSEVEAAVAADSCAD
jgi:predicted N-acetyltransferase YhbS